MQAQTTARRTAAPAPGTLPNQRESELRALMTMASHDLKNPLASVAAHVEMLRADYAGTLGEDFQRDLAIIERGLARMSRLTKDLLDYAKADHNLNLAPSSLEEIVSDVVAEHLTSPDTARITVNGTLPTVVADGTLLRHVVDNLVGNAIKYTRAGETPQIEISARTLPDGSTRIEVADHGIGIPDADRPKIFDAFHRCTNSGGYPGTGLGLAICHRIIERHNGHIEATENSGGGSRFRITIPTLTPTK
ncbi:HAMP domain-containing sensor histidine kinase [Actinoplanes sp. NPDC049668]|uniref:sensor histidine kinase n=1 Tax=unclassified Actinoplanes TaxID=2626549 RepID=UPI0033B58880